jgi:small subunit ribosomal protein S1
MIEGQSTPQAETGNLPSPDRGLPSETEAAISPEPGQNPPRENGDSDPEEKLVVEESAPPAADSPMEDSPSARAADSPSAIGDSPSAMAADSPSAIGDSTLAVADSPSAVSDRTPAMTDPPFAELLEKSLERTRPIRPGDRLNAVVQRIEDEFSFLDYGGPSEALIETRQLRDSEGKLKVQMGERIDVTVAAVGDQVTVHLVVRKPRDRSVLKQAFASKSPIEGKVTGTNKGGFEVQIAGLRAFCPISQIDRVYCSDPQVYVGQTLPFRIIEYKEGGRRVVISRRALLEEERRSEADKTRSRLQVGDEIEGTVVRLQPFGAFVDIGGLDGLVHVSELRHGRVTNPAEATGVGQKLKVKVIGIENLGAEKGERISLSARALETDPWSTVGEQLAVGMVAQGRVLRLMNYGAFVEVLPGVEGLLHLSEMGEKRYRHPSEVVAEQSTIEVRVLELDAERRRLSLSMRAPGEHRSEPEAPGVKLVAGMSVEGTVSSVKPYGVFVRILEPVSGVDGLLPAQEVQAGSESGEDLARSFPMGTAVRAEVLRVDNLGRIRLTQRSAAERAERPEHTADRERGLGRGHEGGQEQEGRRDEGRSHREGHRVHDDHEGGREREGSRRGRRREHTPRGEAGRESSRDHGRESQRGQGSRRDPHREPRSQPSENDQTAEERRQPSPATAGLGIMAKAFRRVLDGR